MSSSLAGLHGLTRGETSVTAAGSTVTGSSVEQVLSRLGAAGTGTLAFLGVTFMIIAIVLTAEAAAQVSAARAEEAEGSLDHQLVGTVSRVQWLLGRLGIAALALVLSGVAAGLFTWIGAASQRSGVSIWTALDAGINTVPPAMFVLGVGALALGLWPRQAAVAVYLVLGWSALIELTGGFVGENHWVSDTSLFHQMASAPAVRPDWTTNGILIAAALLAMAAGTAAIRRVTSAANSRTHRIGTARLGFGGRADEVVPKSRPSRLLRTNMSAGSPVHSGTPFQPRCDRNRGRARGADTLIGIRNYAVQAPCRAGGRTGLRSASCATSVKRDPLALTAR